MHTEGAGRVGTKICYVVAPSGQKGGGMGRVKDYILQAGPEAAGHLRFVALDTRGQGSAAASVWLSLKALIRIFASALAGQVALVHVNMGDRASAVRKGVIATVVSLTGIPVYLHLHAAELTDHHARLPGFLRYLLGVPFRRATCCIVLGTLWRDWLIREFGVPADRIEVLYNGVPVPAGTGQRPEAQPGRPLQLLFLGNLLERKGLSDLLVALSLLPPDAPDWRAIIAGGGDIPFYTAKAASLGLADKVQFVGWVDQAGARRLLADSDVMALPSYDEGLPLVILESLGCGTPVLCTPVGAIPEVLTDNVSVAFAPPGNPAALSARLAQLFADSTLRADLSRQGLALYRERFTVEAFVSRLVDIYRRHCPDLFTDRATGSGGHVH
jgi:glycosyltransferase involved in cell wall biosynthesis